MAKLLKGTKIPDAVEMAQAAAKNVIHGALVTPGAAVNVDVAPGYGTVNGTDVRIDGATNLATAAPGTAGHTIRYAICVDTAGAITAVAGTEVATGSQVAPTIDETVKTVIATVDVANGDATVAQSKIDNSARNWL